jgi:hypothetical protein
MGSIRLLPTSGSLQKVARESAKLARRQAKKTKKLARQEQARQAKTSGR